MAHYEITLRDYWRILRRRKSIVLFTAVLLGSFSFAAAFIFKPKPLYEAVAKVQISANQTLTGIYLQTISYNSGDQLETQQAVITSYPVLKRAGEALGRFAGGDTARAVLAMQRSVTTRQQGYTNIISIVATHPDPLQAQALADTVAVAYQIFNHEQKNQQAVKHRRFVEEQRDRAREALAVAENRVRAYREDTGLVSMEAQASVMLGQITKTERDAAVLEQTLSDIEAMITEMTTAGGLSEKTMQGAAKAQVGEAFMNLTYQLNNLTLDRDALLVQYTPDHPRVAQLQVKIDLISGNMLDELRKRHQATQREVTTIRSRLAALRQEYRLLPSRGLQLDRLKREALMHQQVLAALEEEYQEALIREADKVEEVSILQRAVLPTRPVNPSRPLQRALLGVMLGVILGVVFAVIVESLDTSIGTIDDVQEYTGAQVVGVIPFINSEDVAESLRRQGITGLDDHALQRRKQLITLFDPQSTLSETFRTLRTNIEFVTVEKGIRTLMVTSSTSQEGKSTITANLAMTIARLGKRVLLVDCDLRKPTIARVFGLDRDPGLSEVIVGNYDWQDVIRTVTDIVTGGLGLEDITRAQSISNLHIVTSGTIPPNPAELLNSQRMSEFLAEAAQNYDVVMLDAPPVLHVTDAAILGKQVDSALMVYMSGDVPRTSLRRAVTLLRGVEVDLLGVVINGIRAEISSEYQDLGYSSYYGYGSNDTLRQRTLGARLRKWIGQRRHRGAGDDATQATDSGQAETNAGEDESGKSAADAVGALDPDEPGDVAPAPPPALPSAHRGRRVASAVLLVAFVLGAIWQLGLFHPLTWGVTAGSAPTTTISPTPRDSGGNGVAGSDTPGLQVLDSVIGDDQDAAAAGGTGGLRSAAAGGADTARTIASSSAAPSAALEEEQRPAPFTIRVAAYDARSAWGKHNLEMLRAAGEPAFFSPVNVGSRDLVRLLVGSFPSWDAAFAHASKLQSAEMLHEFTISRLPYAVALDPGDAGTGAVAGGEAAVTVSSYAYSRLPGDASSGLLAGAFETEEEARGFAQRLRSTGTDAMVTQR